MNKEAPTQYIVGMKGTCFIREGLAVEDFEEVLLPSCTPLAGSTPKCYEYRLAYIERADSVEGLKERNAIVDKAIGKYFKKRG